MYRLYRKCCSRRKRKSSGGENAAVPVTLQMVRFPSFLRDVRSPPLHELFQDENISSHVRNLIINSRLMKEVIRFKWKSYGKRELRSRAYTYMLMLIVLNVSMQMNTTIHLDLKEEDKEPDAFYHDDDNKDGPF